jgi:mono/diheme cytochrome c family protein
MRILRVAIAVVIVLALAAIVFLWWTEPAVIASIDPPAASSFDAKLIERGAKLSAMGNCGTCHTAPGGPEYAGNRPIATPYGTVYSTNITPAPGSGIGRWSEEAFSRAMRQGISRRGEHLYPAFPYDHFARLSDEDIRALYAFVMTRSPIEVYRKENDLPFPIDRRWLLTFWNLLFLDETPFRPDPQQSPEWNRGAYLVAGLGHCGACHTPRNVLGAEKRGRDLDGGEAEGWTGPALNAASPAPVPWDAAHLFAYLRTGRDAEHGSAAGPMQPVTDNLAAVDEADVRAIAAYLASRQGEPSAARRERAAKALAQSERGQMPQPGPGEEQAAAIFAGACAGCHVGGRETAPPRGIDLALSTEINDGDPRNAIMVVLDGIAPVAGESGPLMPGFAGTFTDAQLAALLRYLRAHYSDGPAWSDLDGVVRSIRQSRGRR